MKIKRILVGLGGTEYTSVAVERCIDLAHRHQAEITGVTIIDESRLRAVGPVPVGAAHAAQALRAHRLDVSQERVREAISAFEQKCQAHQLPFRIHQETGEPFSTLTSLARYHDLMIFGLRSVFDCGLGVDPQDVLARLVGAGVRPIVAVSKTYRDVKRVLLAYSGSPESAKCIKRFVQSRLWPSMQLRLLTCERPEQEAQVLLRDMSDYCRAHGYEVEQEYSPEPPKHQILDAAARWNADLVVLGNGSRSLWINRILGSTAYQVVQNVDRPIYLSQ